MNTISKIISETRKNKKLSQAAASRLTGISQGHLNKLERENRPYEPKTLRRLATGYGLDYLWLMVVAGHVDMEDYQKARRK